MTASRSSSARLSPSAAPATGASDAAGGARATAAARVRAVVSRAGSLRADEHTDRARIGYVRARVGQRRVTRTSPRCGFILICISTQSETF